MVAFSIKNFDKKVMDALYEHLNKSTLSDIKYEPYFSKGYYIIVFNYFGPCFTNFLSNFSDVIASFILKYYEPILVNRLISTEYFYFDNDEQKVIFQEFNLLNKPSIVRSNKKIISRAVLKYATQNSFFVFDGFVNFSLYDYIDVLKRLVQESVNQYLIDKEYLRFVELLRNYVKNSNSKSSTIHLLYVNAEAFLIDESGKDIKLEDFSNTYVSDISFSKNDYVLNTLIGLVPEKIIIHLLSPYDQFTKTIELIFEDKAHICTSCSLCKNYIQNTTKR